MLIPYIMDTRNTPFKQAQHPVSGRKATLSKIEKVCSCCRGRLLRREIAG